MARRVTQSKSKVSSERGSFGGKVNTAGLKDAGRVDGGFAPPRDPKLPPKLAVTPVREFTFSTVAGTISFTAMGIGKVTGGVPELIETEIVGRTAGTSLGDHSRMQAVLEFGVFGRLNGNNVSRPVETLSRLAVAGRLVRLYGPLDRVGVQGAVWWIGDPAPADTDMRRDGKFSHATWQLTLQQWTPLDAVAVTKAGGAAARVRARIKDPLATNPVAPGDPMGVRL